MIDILIITWQLDLNAQQFTFTSYRYKEAYELSFLKFNKKSDLMRCLTGYYFYNSHKAFDDLLFCVTIILVLIIM